MAVQQEKPPFAYGGAILSQLAGLARLAPIYLYPGSLVVATATTKVFCQSSLGNGVAGAVVGVYFYLDSEDYQTSPVSLVPIAAQSGAASQTSGTTLGGSPWTMQLGRDRTPLYFPTPFGIPWEAGRGVGLQVTNNESVSLYVEGLLAVSAWSVDQLRQAQEDLDRKSGATPFGAAGRVF